MSETSEAATPFDPETVRAKYLAERDRRLVEGRSAIRDLTHDDVFAAFRRDPFTPVVPLKPNGPFAVSDDARLIILQGPQGRSEANLLVCPNIDAANISYNLLKTAAGGGIAIGPVLLGAAKPVHILTPSATVRRIVNMTALTVADANAAR